MSPSLHQLYRTLDLESGASPDEIKRAYHKLARRLHPDLAGDDPRLRNAFDKVKLAYEILNDPDKRAAFETSVEAARIDANINAAVQRAGRGVGRAWAALRRRRNAARPSERSRDLLYRLELPLAALVADSAHSIDVPRPGPCLSCAGRPSADGAPCPTCDGAGRTTVIERTTLRVPGGVAHNARLRLRGLGERGERPGDLLVQVQVLPDERFRRAGLDILSRQRIPFTRALAGLEVQVQTLRGPRPLKLGKGTPSGASFRLKGQGLPDPAGSTPGDHVVELIYRVPELTPEQLDQLLSWELDEESA